MRAYSCAAGYSYVKATYETELELVNEVNLSSGNDVIEVGKGDRPT